MDTQTLTWKVPASLIPLRTVTAESATNALGETTHTIQQNQEAYPIRLFDPGGLGRDRRISIRTPTDHPIAHSKDGTTSFYSNAWHAAAKDDAQYGTATAVFTPAASNAFYHYTEDTPLYVLVDNVAGGSQEAADAPGGPGTPAPVHCYSRARDRCDRWNDLRAQYRARSGGA